ncbi:M20/M25/M40 family metallo-hydrolase [Aquimarina brevivitae]|nr:M20/M25/M40 family metallo-hydrolase [Aquimarina brevivitae]
MDKVILLMSLIVLVTHLGAAQNTVDQRIDANFKNTLLLHKALVSLPNLPDNEASMLDNINWVAKEYRQSDFTTTLLPTSTLPILLAEKVIDPKLKTVLFYFHIDGQPINPQSWDQKDPFIPVLKKKNTNDQWQTLDWSALNETIDDEWRIFARAAADDKAPIIMLLEALRVLKLEMKKEPQFNIKIIFDPEEEYGSKALLSTLETYKDRYAADYFIVMDGPMHPTNKPTLTFGCRGIASCSITTYGAKLPQHSGHYGNYVPNPVFHLAKLLASMKDDQGKVLIQEYYKGIGIDQKINLLLKAVPYDATALHTQLGIYSSEEVGQTYQEALQYPSLNVRQIETSWKGKGLKTVIPAYATAHMDVRLVPETEGTEQLAKIKQHIIQQGYYVIDRDPTDEERLTYPKIAKFIAAPRVINAFRTNPEANFGKQIRSQLSNEFEDTPIVIRLMGGTVPIVPLINALDLPTLIVPMVNMDNNQHSPNENIRVGNIRQGIKICLAILNTKL